MIVNNLNTVEVTSFGNETNTVLIVDSNAILTCTVTM